MNLERRHTVTGGSLRASSPSEGSGRVISGYCALFNSPSVLMCERGIGPFTEIILPGAFRDTLQIADVRALVQHDDATPIGRLGRNLTLQEDETGLFFTCTLPETQAARDLIALVEADIVTGCSFGFIADQDHVEAGADGTVIRYLDRVSLIEVTLGCTFPAYTATSISVRSVQEWFDRQAAEEVSIETPEPEGTPKLDRARRIILVDE